MATWLASLAEMGARLERKLEPDLWSHSPYIAEFWNTVSNVLFIALGLLRYWECRNHMIASERGYAMPRLWLMFALSGLCSAFHHSQRITGTIVIDWVPIVAQGAYVAKWHPHLLRWVSPASWFGTALAFAILAVDHVYVLLPPPWGHSKWHIAAAYAFSAVYVDMSRYYLPLLPVQLKPSPATSPPSSTREHTS